MKRIASCAFGVSQNVLTTRSALPRMRTFLMRLITIQYHDIADMMIRVAATTSWTT